MGGNDLDFCLFLITQAASHQICTPSIYSQQSQLRLINMIKSDLRSKVRAEDSEDQIMFLPLKVSLLFRFHQKS